MDLKLTISATCLSTKLNLVEYSEKLREYAMAVILSKGKVLIDRVVQTIAI